MRRNVRFAEAAFLVCLLLCSAALGKTMYARLAVSVRSDRSLSAKVVAKLKQGQAVEVVGKERRHYKVRVAGQVGWVYYNKLAEEKPEDVAALLAGAPAGGAIELSELEAGGALRGLSPMAEGYAASRNIPAWAVQAVEQMQALKVTVEELDEFMKAGGLGEFGEEG